MKHGEGWIPTKLYNKIQRTVPIVCVDLIIKTKKGFLMGKRNNHPAKGTVWFLGGRLLWGESFEHAVEREAREEAGIRVKIKKFVGVYSTTFSDGGRKHTVNFTYLVEKTSGEPRPEAQHSGFVYIHRNEKYLPTYVRRVLSESRVFRK